MNGNAVFRTGFFVAAAFVLLARGAAAQTVTDLAPTTVESASEWLGDALTGEFTDPFVRPAANFQPPAAEPARTPARAPARRGSTSRQSNILLADVPPMFGDFGMMTASASFVDRTGEFEMVGTTDIPGAGGSRRVKIGENNSPIPQDRVFFMYNHFHNVYSFEAIQSTPIPTPVQRQLPIDRYILGIEKTFLDEWWSVEMRMPFNGAINMESQDVHVNGGNYGNLAVIVKRLLYMDSAFGLAAGLGLDLPTGSSATAEFGQAEIRFENDAVHLLPYVGAVATPTDNLFCMAFLQIDVAAGGNEVLFGPLGNPRNSAGNFTEQNLLYFDLSGGYWLYRNDYAEWITGLAGLLEFHYTTSLQDTDEVVIAGQQFQTVIDNPVNRFDVVNVSTGVNVAFGPMANLRVAGVFPLGDELDRRFFDAEVQVQFNHRF